MSFDKDKMHNYLVKLDQKIKKHKWGGMIVDADVSSFKVIYKSSTEGYSSFLFSKIYGNMKYANKKIGIIDLCCYPEMLDEGAIAIGSPWVMAITIHIYRLNDKAEKRPGFGNQWSLSLNLFPKDLEEKPFTLDLVKKMLIMVKDKAVTSDISGLNGYQALINKIEKVKAKMKKTKKKKK